MKIGCLQFAPAVGDVENNIKRANEILTKANPEGLDLLVLPEMAFSGKLCVIISLFGFIFKFLRVVPALDNFLVLVLISIYGPAV